MSRLVAPFFRASVTIGPAERALFVRTRPRTELDRAVYATNAILRDNLRRLAAAAWLAEATGDRLAFVEGFRSNRIIRRPDRPPRFVTGSWIFGLMLRLLRRRGLVGRVTAPLRREISRCTSEETQALLRLAEGSPVVGVAGDVCPSSSRARRYLRDAPRRSEILTPGHALGRAGVLLSPERASFWQATAPRGAEVWGAPFVEAPNWALHVLSEATRAFFGQRPLERRIAHVLRPDR
jgi:hypothetical protein